MVVNKGGLKCVMVALSVKGYLVELVDCDKGVVMALKRNLSQPDLCILKFPVEVVTGKGGRVVKYEAKRVIDKRRVFVVVFSSNYLPISHKFEISYPWPFSRRYAFGQAFLTSRLLGGIGYSIFIINLNSIHLLFSLTVNVKKVEVQEVRDFISELRKLDLGQIEPDNPIQKTVERAEKDLHDPSIKKPQDIPLLKSPQEAYDHFLALTTNGLLRRMKRALNDDLEIRTAGKHQYKVVLKKTNKSAPVPDHGELPNYFPKVICKELGIDEAYNITCDEFLDLIRKRKRLVRR